MNKRHLRGLDNPNCIDLTGEKIGKLTILKIDPTKTKRVFWLCKCECGNVKSIAAKHIRGRKGQRIKSCGCSHHLTGKENPCWKGYEDISGRKWWTIKRAAKERNLQFSISPKYVWGIFQKQKGKCALTGKGLTFHSRSDKSDGTASLDRIDNAKGYVEGNVQWVHKDINIMKLNHNTKHFLTLCKEVVQYNKL